MFVPPPATVALNVVVDESDTKVLVPAPDVTALGNVATVYTVDAVLVKLITIPKALFSWLKYKRNTLAN